MGRIKPMRDRYSKRRENQAYVLDALTRTDTKAMFKRSDGKFEVVKIQFGVGDEAYEYYPHYNSRGEDLFVFDTAKEALIFYETLRTVQAPTLEDLIGEPQTIEL